MQCKVCNLHFNQFERCPRILLNCGHTTCQACISKMLNSSVNACPFCGTPVNARTIDEFPKNLILIGKPTANLNSECCPHHNKFLEAFCDNDKSLLCIDCILGGAHKLHNVMPCELAFQKEQQIIATKAAECAPSEAIAKQALESCSQYQSMIKEKANESKESISLFYMQIKSILHERENSLKQNINTILERELQNISQYSLEIENYISVIKKFNDEVITLKKETMIQTLKNSSGRYQLIQQMAQIPHEISKSIQFPEIIKEVEIAHLSELVLKTHSKNGSMSTKHKDIRSNRGYNTNRSKDSFGNYLSNISEKSTSPKKVFRLGRKDISQVGNITVNSEEDKSVHDSIKHNSFLASTMRNADFKHKILENAQKNAVNTKKGLNSTLKLFINDKPMYSKRVEIAVTPEIKSCAKPLSKLKNGGYKKADVRKSSSGIYKRQISLSKMYSMDQTVTSRVKYTDKTENPTVARKVETNITKSNISSPDKQKDKEKDKEKVSVFNIDLKTENSNTSITKDYICSTYVTNELQPMNYINKDNNTNFLDNSSDISATKSKLNITPSMLETYKNTDKIDLNSLIMTVSNYIIVISGCHKSFTSDCEKYEIEKKQWKPCASISQPKFKFSASMMSESKILIFGGRTVNGTRCDEIELYDAEKNAWKVLRVKLSKPRSSMASISDSKGVYISGGSDGTILNSFSYLNFLTLEWIKLCDMNYKREEHGMAIGTDNKVYAIGGFDGKECLKVAERFDIEKGRWEKIASMINQRRSLCVVTLPDGIYAIGGFDGSHYLSSVEK